MSLYRIKGLAEWRVMQALAQRWDQQGCAARTIAVLYWTDTRPED